MFKRFLGNKRPGNFLAELSWQGWCLMIGGCMVTAGALILSGIWSYPGGDEPYIGAGIGTVVGIALVVVGVIKR